MLRKVLPKVLKGTYRYDVLQNVTDRLTGQELSTRVRAIIREAAGLPDTESRRSEWAVRKDPAVVRSRGPADAGFHRDRRDRCPGISFMPAKRDFANRALQASPIT